MMTSDQRAETQNHSEPRKNIVKRADRPEMLSAINSAAAERACVAIQECDLRAAEADSRLSGEKR